MDSARNDLSTAVPKFCLALEQFRRTHDGRVQAPQDFLAHFFPYGETEATDRLFCFMPKTVRGPVVSGWGIRGVKAALRDDDDRVRSVVHDALVAGDINAVSFEQALPPEILIAWIPIEDWWAFWRAGKMSKNALQKAFSTAYDLGLFDAAWFLGTIEARGGKLRGTDVLSEGLSKDDLSDWVRRIHESRDGSPKGLIAALGWEKIVLKTLSDVLVHVLDALAAKLSLKQGGAADSAVGANGNRSSRNDDTSPSDETTVSDKGDSSPFAARDAGDDDIVVVHDDELDRPSRPPKDEARHSANERPTARRLRSASLLGREK